MGRHPQIHGFYGCWYKQLSGSSYVLVAIFVFLWGTEVAGRTVWCKADSIPIQTDGDAGVLGSRHRGCKQNRDRGDGGRDSG